MSAPRKLRSLWFALATLITVFDAGAKPALAQAAPQIAETTDLPAWAQTVHRALGPTVGPAKLQRAGSIEWTVWMKEPDQAYLEKCHWRRGVKIVVVINRFASAEEARNDVEVQITEAAKRPHDARVEMRANGLPVEDGVFLESHWKQEACGVWGERVSEFRVGNYNVNVWEISSSSPVPDTSFLRRLIALTSDLAGADPAGGSAPIAGFGEAQIRAALWRRVGQEEGPLARKCFDETYAKLNEARNAEMKERIEQAAYREHMVEVAVEMANADDFDPKWLDAAKRIGGSGSPAQRVADKLVKLLPPPLNTLIELSQKSYRLSTGVNEKVILPKLEAKLYEAFANERAQRPNDPPGEVLKDASTHVGSWEKLKTDLLPHFPGANDAAREEALAAYLAARFDFLAKVRSVAANRSQHLADAWKEAVDDVARVKMNVLACMSM